ncbi:MAG TPA: S41 family peptidase [Candidatus Angelobacter sp.]
MVLSAAITGWSSLVRAQQPAQSPASPATLAVSPKNASPTTDPDAIEVLNNYLVAIGGAQAWDSVKAEAVESEIQVMGTTLHTTTVQEVATHRSYTKIETARGIIELGFDGQRVWQKSPSLHGYMADTDPQAQSLKNPPLELRHFRTGKEAYTRLPDETIDGTKYQVLKTTRQVLGQELTVKCYFDPVTHLAARTVVGNVGLAVSTFSDYRSIEGRMVPFSVGISTGMAGQTEIKFLSYKFNPTYDPTIFDFEPGSEKHPDPGSSTKAPASPEEPVKKTASVPSLTPSYKDDDVIPEQMRLDTFELVWGKINDSYWDKSFGGLDWKGVHDEYLPKAKETPTSGDFHNVLNQMVAKLKSSHFSVDSPSEVLALNVTAKEIKNGSLGMTLHWIDGQLLVTHLRKSYPAEVAGIRLGYVVTRINGSTADEMLSTYRKKHQGFDLRPELLYRAAAYSELGGHPGDKVELDVLNEKDKSIHLNLVLKAVPLDEDVMFESKKLAGNIGYIEFGAFFGEVLDKFKKAVSDLHGTNGLVIDLRGNPGGLIELGPHMANLLCSSPGSLGTFTFRYEKQDFSFKGSGENAYAGRIVVLVDESSISSAEVFSGGLQDLGRVTVIGSRSAGAVLASTVTLLPTGGLFQYVISNFETPKGTMLEGRGVIPQLEARPSRQTLLAGRDPALEAATNFLRHGGTLAGTK